MLREHFISLLCLKTTSSKNKPYVNFLNLQQNTLLKTQSTPLEKECECAVTSLALRNCPYFGVGKAFCVHIIPSYLYDAKAEQISV